MPELTEPNIIYVTLDGILQPLGASQVVAYLKRMRPELAGVEIVSFERDSDLSDEERVQEVSIELARHEIEWSPLSYKRGPRGALKNLLAGVTQLTSSVRSDLEGPTLIHARGYIPAFIAALVSMSTGVPYLFDFRGFWVDERQLAGGMFEHLPIYGTGKAVERLLFDRAAGWVSLTQLASDDIRAGHFGQHAAQVPGRVITTCADFERFAPPRKRELPERYRHLAGTLESGPVIAYVGSLNPSYEVNESFEFCAELARVRPSVIILIISKQANELKEVALEMGVPNDRVIAVSADHSEMPAWLSWVDWAVLLLTSHPSKRASMPTKFAEFLANGISVVQHGCNSELSRWVEDLEIGLVLQSLESEDLARAARVVAMSMAVKPNPERIRARAREHFAVQAGVRRYLDLYQEL